MDQNQWNPFPNHLIDDAVSRAYDPGRSNSENLARMSDHVSQFTGPLDRDQANRLEMDLSDELGRRRAFNPFYNGQ